MNSFIEDFESMFPKFNSLVGNTMKYTIDDDKTSFEINNDYSISFEDDVENSYVVCRIIHIPGDYMNPSDIDYEYLCDFNSLESALSMVTSKIISDRIHDLNESLAFEKMMLD